MDVHWIVGPGGTTSHIASGGDVAHAGGVIGDGQIVRAVQCRGQQPIVGVVVKILRQPLVVILSLGDIAHVVVGIGVVLQRRSTAYTGLYTTNPARDGIEDPIRDDPVAKRLFGHLSPRIGGVGGPIDGAGVRVGDRG